MKIAFFEVQNWEKEYFQKELGGEHELIFFSQHLDETSILKIKDIDILSVFIYSSITQEVLDSLPNLKLIASMSTGVDHIDIKECKKRGVTVSNVPTYGENTVAEHTFALILSITRRIVDSYRRVKDGNFSPEGLIGFDLFGKTIGIIGIGNIGKNVVGIARGFEMRVLGFKRTPDPVLARELGFTFVSLDELLLQSDIITLHIPYNNETHHFLNQEKFSKMKDGVIIINTSRGGIVDTNALLQALNSGRVAGAGLDVLEEEPILREEKELLSHEFKKEELLRTLQNHMLLNHPKVVITPHNAFNSHEALEKIVKTTVENIRKFISGNVINRIP